MSSLAPGLGQAVLVGCPPLTAQIKLPALPFTLQGLQLKGSLMGGWPNSLTAIQDLVEGYMEHRQPDIDMLVGIIVCGYSFYIHTYRTLQVTREIKLENLNEAFKDMMTPDSPDLRIKIIY